MKPGRSRPPTPSRMNGPVSKKAGSWTDMGQVLSAPNGKPRRGSVDEFTKGGPAPSDSSRKSLDDSVLRSSRAERAESGEGNNVKVYIRVRPANNMELEDDDAQTSVAVTSAQTCDLTVEGKTDPHHFAFDHVFTQETTQLEMSEATGVPLVQNCMKGYNSTIFAYGQTGAGKTHTMIGALEDKDQRGLSPRVFDMLFNQIKFEEQQGSRFVVKCSFLEIYNETITDLLEPSITNLQVREGAQSGAYVEGLTSVKVDSAEMALALMKKGTDNRKVSETKANRTSSRSHMVYTCIVEKTVTSESGLERKTYSRLNLVDLAGSERNRVTGAKSNTIKEACHINQSLSALGRVIRGLVDSYKTGHGHIPYRDSKLTYLLQESLGGNAKTSIIANISPMSLNAGETLSTLLFVKSAKNIRQRFKVNEATNHQSEAMQKEVRMLKMELDNLKVQVAEPAMRENAALKERMRAEMDRLLELQNRLDETAASNEQFKEQAFALQQEVRDLKDAKASLVEGLDDLLNQCEHLGTMCSDADAMKEKAHIAELKSLQQELEGQKEKSRQEVLAKEQNVHDREEIEAKLSNLNLELQMLRNREKDILADLETSQSSVAKFQEEIENLTEDLAASRTAHDALQQRETYLTQELATTKGCLEEREEELKGKQAELNFATEQISLKDQDSQLLRDAVAKYKRDLQHTRDEHSLAVSDVTSSEHTIKLLQQSLDAQDSKLRGTEETLLRMKAAHDHKNEEVSTLQAELEAMKLRLKETETACSKVKGEKSELEERLATFKEENSVHAQARLQLQNDMDEIQYTSQNYVDEQNQEIEGLHRTYKEYQERASDAESRLDQMSSELERLFQCNFQYSSYFDTIDSLLIDIEKDCPPEVARLMKEYERNGDGKWSVKKSATRKSGRKSEMSHPISPPAAALRYGVAGQLPGGFEAYCQAMAPQGRAHHVRQGSMSARESRWKPGFL